MISHYWADGPTLAEHPRQPDPPASSRRRSPSPVNNLPPSNNSNARRDRSRSPMKIDSDKPLGRGRSVFFPSSDCPLDSRSSIAPVPSKTKLITPSLLAPPMAIITLGTTSTYLGLVLELKTQTCMNYSPNMVQKAQLMRDPNTKEVRGFGFVTMETCEEADAAMTALNGADLFGKPLGVEKARRGRARTPTPGQYFGPAKRDERRYDPRGGGGGYGGGGGGGGGYRAEDRYGGYPERRERRYDDRGPPPGRDDRYGYAAPMRAERDRYDDRRDYDRPRRDDRDYDRRY
ncbi:hypothetical protein PGTUg99_025640 [Puccinia graminis f. sp. tritici]|uniref:RRM domain-containing protein n=1 Tax=Puccinia graminis f. sp. tritici TaxID=56615 RepID=A0A5B0MEF3_PUCGR|nr:hypothetical protein PGTUg99_025640 [Puccinia graminis f. sp. tritici]